MENLSLNSSKRFLKENINIHIINILYRSKYSDTEICKQQAQH